MKQFIISEEQRNNILGYLFGRPYGEVARGVEMLQGLPEHRPVTAEDPVIEQKVVELPAKKG